MHGGFSFGGSGLDCRPTGDVPADGWGFRV